MTKNRSVRRNPKKLGKPPLEALRDEERAGVIHHGGVIRSAMGDEAAAEQFSKAIDESIHSGIESLENGCEFAPDMEPVPGSPVEVFDIFDVTNGDNVVLWRVACRLRSKHAS